ncbi:condensation domain-containing protein [Streptomyces sp. AC602_WCS936]|uniref:condensation domain-containing protein n=1 Tax=Streptomyces sp. AC602_WCS936 TaxID=2823685 RepID=UPI001C281463|nr:condensation domain-containing protein [Streptomyces sp. AC602_WCS936]
MTTTDTPATASIIHPLSPQQRRMLEFIGGRTDSYYLMVEAFVLKGDLDVGALRQGAVNVLDRHDVLRSVYPADQDGYRTIGPGADLIDRIWIEAPGGRFASADEALAAGLDTAARPMGLDSEPPLRMWLTRLNQTEAVLIVCGHHLVFDAWTFMLFYEDLAAEYRTLTAGGKPRRLPQQYSDAQAPQDDDALDGWSTLLGRRYLATRALDACAKTPKGPGAVHRRVWPGLSAGVLGAARHHSVTPFVIASVAMLQALSDVLGDEEAVFGSAYAGRTTAASANALGYYSTTLFVGEDLGAHSSVDQLISSVNSGLKRWHHCARIQWEDLLARYDANDLYPVKFAFQPKELAERQLKLPGIDTSRISRKKANLSARRPVNFIGSYDADVVSVSVITRTDVLTDDQATSLIDGFGRRLTALAESASAR